MSLQRTLALSITRIAPSPSTSTILFGSLRDRNQWGRVAGPPWPDFRLTLLRLRAPFRLLTMLQAAVMTIGLPRLRAGIRHYSTVLLHVVVAEDFIRAVTVGSGAAQQQRMDSVCIHPDGVRIVLL